MLLLDKSKRFFRGRTFDSLGMLRSLFSVLYQKALNIWVLYYI